MRFAYPQFLWLLLILGPLLAAFLVWSWYRKQTLIAQFVPRRLLPQLTDRISRPRQKLRLVLLGLAALCAMLALARPQWGYEWQEVRHRGLDLVVAIDTSRSMLAEDMPPNRLTRAKLAALDLAQLSRSDRFALVPFAGSAYLQCPLTLDYEVFRQNLEAVSPDIMPQGGTSLAQAIRIARDTLQDSTDNDKALVLITDGEDHDGGALNAAREATLAGLRIFTVGVGSPEGALLQYIDHSGALQYIKDPQGNAVLSRLNEGLLQQVAREGNGFYIPLRAPNAIETLAQQGLAPLTRSDQSTRMVRRFHEQFHWPLALALAFLLLECFLSERRPAPRTATAPSRSNRATVRVAAGLATLLLVSALTASPARALKQFEAGAFEDAEAIYQKLLEQRGPDPRLHFNRGTAAYRRGDFNTAAHDFAEAATATDLALQQRAHYNLGNALYRLGEQLGDDRQRVEPWNQAVQSYQAALQLQPDDPDADFNLRFVQQQLQALSPPPPSPAPSDSQDPEDPSEEPADSDPSPGAQSQPETSDSPPPPSDPSGSTSSPPQDPSNDPQDPGPTPDSPPADPDHQDQQDPPSDAGTQSSDRETASPAHAGPMTPEEANQLLDAASQEERPMIFAPPAPASPSRTLKDW